jgi:hypothetical protein
MMFYKESKADQKRREKKREKEKTERKRYESLQREQDDILLSLVV